MTAVTTGASTVPSDVSRPRRVPHAPQGGKGGRCDVVGGGPTGSARGIGGTETRGLAPWRARVREVVCSFPARAAPDGGPKTPRELPMTTPSLLTRARVPVADLLRSTANRAPQPSTQRLR